MVRAAWCCPQSLEGFEEKRLDIVRLQATCIGAFHVCTDTLHFAGVHGVVGQCPLVEQALQVSRIECRVEHGGEKRFDLRLLTVTDCLDQQFAQRHCFAFRLKSKFAEHVEDLPAQRLSGLFKFFQQFAINIAFTGIVCDQIPKMADLGLADPVDAAESAAQAGWDSRAGRN